MFFSVTLLHGNQVRELVLSRAEEDSSTWLANIEQKSLQKINFLWS